MPPVSGNIFTLAIGRQTAKGTAQTTPAFKLKTTGGDLNPTRQTVQLAETDASRQQGKLLVVGAHVEGTFECYLRPHDWAFLAYALLGANATTGSSPNYIHTATPANSHPYLTIYKMLGNVIVDRYVDCCITTATIRGEAGGALTTSLGITGLSATFGETDPVLAPVTEDPFIFPEVRLTKGGAQPGTTQSFEITIGNGGQLIPRDGWITPYDYVWGELAVGGNFTLLFENADDYRRFHTGSPTGTALSTDQATELLRIDAIRTADLNVAFYMAGVAVREFTAAPDPGGAPVRAVYGFASQPQASIANYFSSITKNQAAAV